MFGSDDDTDFMPSSSSKLASLFGGAQSTNDSNATFTFAAPKQPKKITSGSTSRMSGTSASQASVRSDGSNKLSIIIVKAVHTYLLENGKYTPQGKLGAAILGNSTTHIYQLLLYKGKQQHITSTTIKPDFQFTIQANNYSTFYNDHGQNWSLHFEDDKDGEEFAREVGLARAASQGDGDSIQSLLTQVLSVPSDAEAPVAGIGDTMEIYYTVQTYAAGKLGQLVESNREAAKPQRVKIRTNVWEEGLIGAASGTKRMILLPSSILNPWKSAVPAGTSLVVDVTAGRLKQAPSTEPSLGDSEGSVTDEQSIKARVASISEALTNSPRTHKASIITRMARMGQPTLPLKGALACNPSDSEETGDESSVTSNAVNFKPSKSRGGKSRPFASHSSPSVESQQAVNPPSQLTLYQQVPVGWQQQPAYSMGPYGVGPYHQSHGHGAQPLFASPSSTAVATPTAPAADLSVFFSESRTQNAEVRMAVSKVTDKVEQVLSKLDNVESHRPTYSGPTLDSSSLLATVQKIVQENESLKKELEEKRNKLEVQNDRIYQLLNTNHKYLEQSNSSSVDQETVITALQQDKAKLVAELSEARTLANALQVKEEGRKRDDHEMANMMALVENQKAELAVRKDYVFEQESKLEALREKVKATSDQNDSHERTITELRQLMDEMQSCKAGLEKGLSEVTHHLNVQKSEAEHRVNQLHVQYAAQIEALTNVSVPPDVNLVVVEVKKVMNIVWKNLQVAFQSSSNYDGADIREVLMTTIRDVTNQFVLARTASAADQPAQQPALDLDERDAGDKVTEQDRPSLLGEAVVSGRPVETAIRERLNAASVATRAVKLEAGTEAKVERPKTVAEEIKETAYTTKSDDLEGWRPQPPPPPLFDDEDEEEDAWLSSIG